MTNKHTATKVLATALFLGLLSSGCELILDFNRGLIDGGAVDATFYDATGGDAGVDSSFDAIVVPDAVDAVVFSDALVDARSDAKPADATLDAHKDGGPTTDGHVDAGHEATTGDAHAEAAHPDAAHDGAAHDGAAHDGAADGSGG